MRAAKSAGSGAAARLRDPLMPGPDRWNSSPCVNASTSTTRVVEPSGYSTLPEAERVEGRHRRRRGDERESRRRQIGGARRAGVELEPAVDLGRGGKLRIEPDRRLEIEQRERERRCRDAERRGRRDATPISTI